MHQIWLYTNTQSHIRYMLPSVVEPDPKLRIAAPASYYCIYHRLE
jgi:hypothetical protein